MPDQITNYKCPACGGPLHFSNATQDLACDYCESHFSVQQIEALYAQHDAGAAAATAAAQAASAQQASGGDSWELASDGSWAADAQGLIAYNCPSCGAELICDQTTAASSCPYCGNPTIIPGQLQGMLKPDYVIPFKLDKNAAMEALRKHYKGKKLLPNSFSKENHIEEIKGVYVPFWLFDGEAYADLVFDGTRTHVTETRNERITTTEHYKLHRAGTVPFQKIPVDGASKMPDDHMDAIEPFDYSELKPFSNAYLPGFFADKYDVGVQESAARADERAEQTARDAMRARCSGYTTVTEAGGQVMLHRGKVHYALLPVWMLSTRWNGQNFLFTMNGQTGKLIGNLPVDKGKYWRYFAIATVIATVAATAVMTFLMR